MSFKILVILFAIKKWIILKSAAKIDKISPKKFKTGRTNLDPKNRKSASKNSKSALLISAAKKNRKRPQKNRKRPQKNRKRPQKNRKRPQKNKTFPKSLQNRSELSIL